MVVGTDSTKFMFQNIGLSEESDPETVHMGNVANLLVLESQPPSTCALLLAENEILLSSRISQIEAQWARWSAK